MSSGGGGQSGQTRYDWNDVIGSYWGGKPGADGKGGGGVLGWAAEVATPKEGWQRNPYEQVAGFSNDQRGAFDLARYNAYRGGADDTLAGRQQNIDTSQGKYLNQNAFAQQANQYAGQSPYFRDVLRNGMEDITSAYKNGTSADTTRQFALSGAFGGSAHQNAMANNEAGLAKQLGQYASGMQNDQYNRSAQLDESRLGRGMSAWENERGRMLQGAQGGLQGDALNGALMDRLMNYGGIQQQQGQKEADLRAGQWNNQQNWQRNNVSWLASLLGGAQGSTGIQTQYGGYAPTNYGSTAAGLGLLGASLFGGK